MMARILIVDDERGITGMLKMIFELDEWNVEIANNVTDAQQALLKSTFDLVLTDMRMETPVAGAEVTAFAKQITPPPAVIILSAFPMSPEQWTACGADAFVQKGYTGTSELVNIAKQMVHHHAA
jgi:DNA-binding NtrC family response regulator